jgi:putative PIN family toxin of toxin-antitoxin system
MRAVIDTNVIVSRSVSQKGASARIFDHWLEGRFELVVSEDILAEYERALGYERTRKRHGYTFEQIRDFVDDIRQSAILVVVDTILNIVEADPDDNKIIECAVAGNADYIVSGDAHLLDLGEYQGIQVLPPAAFLLVLEQERAGA